MCNNNSNNKLKQATRVCKIQQIHNTLYLIVFNNHNNKYNKLQSWAGKIMSITNFWPRSALTRRALPDTMATFGRSLTALRWVLLTVNTIQFTNLAQILLVFGVGFSTLKLFFTKFKGVPNRTSVSSLTHTIIYVYIHAQQQLPLTQWERQ